MVTISHKQISNYVFDGGNGVLQISPKGIKKTLNIYKNKHKCEICGSKNNLTFHHTRPQEKRFEIGKLRWRGHYNLTEYQFLRELNQCQLLCSECHNKIHNVEQKG